VEAMSWKQGEAKEEAKEEAKRRGGRERKRRE